MKIVQNFWVEYNGKRVLAGTLGEDKVFRKNVKLRSKLFARDAFGLDKGYVHDAIGCGAEKIELTVTDDDMVYDIDVKTFKQYAVLEKVGKFGNRYYCSLKHWNSRTITQSGSA